MEVVKLVERAMASLEDAALSCFGTDRYRAFCLLWASKGPACEWTWSV